MEYEKLSRNEKKRRNTRNKLHDRSQNRKDPGANTERSDPSEKKHPTKKTGKSR